ncbi:MAG: hypothetical protein FJZ64_03340 [Chlamydiae bacterium]|nr:hypothetical protein [Chlamydiota bacterium]
MNNNLFKKPESADFSKPHVQRSFLEETYSSDELIKKELEVNKSEQLLLNQRLQMMGSFLNELPASDPQYSMLLAQIQMDKIELSELKLREINLTERLTLLEEK